MRRATSTLPRRHGVEVGSLVVVGTGISGVNQTTLEAVEAIERADKLFFIANDVLSEAWLKSRNPSAESLAAFYGAEKLREQSYAEMAVAVIRAVHRGERVCVAVYGHPGMFVQFTHAAIRILRRDGYSASMLPGISAQDCLIADLAVNPGDYGLQAFEATDFLLRRRAFDPRSELLLWQVGVMGEPGMTVSEKRQHSWLQELLVRLERHYPRNHEVTVYEAATSVNRSPRVVKLPLAELVRAPLTPTCTLYVPPLEQRPESLALRKRLNRGITARGLTKPGSRNERRAGRQRGS